jgi:HPt (histidine-containing phosphotransfer) domain-containing protein
MAEPKSAWLNRMSEILGLDHEEILEVAEVFLDTSGEYLDTIKKAKLNYTEAIRSMHSIKGSAANIGLDELSDAALKVENALKKGTDPQEAIERLLQSFEDFKKLMKT